MEFTTAKKNALSIENFIREKPEGILIDVRSPLEYRKGHIPGALNIPLFDNHERAEIGTLYKLNGKEEAVLRGIELVSPKLAGFIKSVKEKSKGNHKVYIYCFRGGMRSGSFCWLLQTAGLEPVKLEGGYKKYRNFVLNFFTQQFPLVLLGGSTGSGKTEVLRKLKDMQVQCADLEAIACHKGSAFGFIGEKEQPAQQQFENELHQEMSLLDPSDTILLEDESFRIGSVKLPYSLWLQMKEAPIIKLVVPFEARVKRLVSDYGNTSIEVLRKPLLAIKESLGPQHCKTALAHLEKGELDKVAEITLRYYDKAYEYNHTKRNYKNIFVLPSNTDDAWANALLVKDFLIGEVVTQHFQKLQSFHG